MPTRKRTTPAAPKPKPTMPPASKRRRTCAPPPPPVPAVPELPVCLLLEIAARTDAATIFRCAATCKQLRREIQSAEFVRRVVCQGVVPSTTLGVLGETFSGVHPRTTAASSDDLEWCISRSSSTPFNVRFLDGYEPQTSRNGVVVLSHREINRRRQSERRSDVCVYDPMTGTRAFLPFAPGIERRPRYYDDDRKVDHHALLTAADGIGCSFMLVAADMAETMDLDLDLDLDCDASSSARVRVQTLSVSSSGTDAGGGGGVQWSTVKITEDHPFPWQGMFWNSHQDPAVVVGGVVHWLLHAPGEWVLNDGDAGEYILTYDVHAAAVGSVDIPEERHLASKLPSASSSQLAASPDGKLCFVATDDEQCTVTVWVLSSSPSGGSSSWARHVEIDMMAEWGQLLGPNPWTDRLELKSFGDQRTGAVFLLVDGVFFVIDMETGATSQTSLTRERGVIPYEVDLASRLASMKSF